MTIGWEVFEIRHQPACKYSSCSFVCGVANQPEQAYLLIYHVAKVFNRRLWQDHDFTNLNREDCGNSLFGRDDHFGFRSEPGRIHAQPSICWLTASPVCVERRNIICVSNQMWFFVNISSPLNNPLISTKSDLEYANNNMHLKHVASLRRTKGVFYN